MINANTSAQTAEPNGAFTVGEFCRVYKISRQTVYNEINAGRLKSYTVGRARRISKQSAREWQQQLEAVA